MLHAILVEVPSLNFHLEQYDGPLDLLLDLIRRQQINIYDIPIASITSQYLEYMRKAAELDMELSAEFVFMAATLIHIKSRMLLPRDPELAKMEAEEDPRSELVARLIEHEKYKNAAEMLQQKRMVEEAVWSNPQIAQYLTEDEGPSLDVGPIDLVKTFQVILERAKSRPVYEIGKENISVPDMMLYIEQLFRKGRKGDTISATELFDRQRSRRAMICLFLAILELVKRQALQLTQGQAFGDIGLRRDEGFESAFGGEDALAAVDQEYS